MRTMESFKTSLRVREAVRSCEEAERKEEEGTNEKGKAKVRSLPLSLDKTPLLPTNVDNDLDEHTRSGRVRFRRLSTSLESTEDGVSRVHAGIACRKRTKSALLIGKREEGAPKSGSPFNPSA